MVLLTVETDVTETVRAGAVVVAVCFAVTVLVSEYMTSTYFTQTTFSGYRGWGH